MGTTLRAALPELLIAALAFCLGAIFLVAIKPGAGVPQAAALQDAKGTLSWVKDNRQGVRFGFKDDQRRFYYNSKGKAVGDVLSALKSAGQKQVRVLFDPKHFNVYDLEVEGRSIRTYDEIKKAWVADDRISPWLGAAFMGCGVILLLSGVKKLKRSNQALQPTAPLRYDFDVDLHWCAETFCHLRVPEPWLSFFSLG